MYYIRAEHRSMFFCWSECA